MAKTLRKKQICIVFEKSQATVALDFDWCQEFKDESAAMTSKSFLRGLMQGSNMQEQTKYISQNKGALRTEVQAQIFPADIAALSFVFFSSESFPIRKSMEWVADFLRKSCLTHKDIVIPALRRACDAVLNGIQNRLAVEKGIDILLDVSFSLNAMALIDRDVAWMSFPGQFNTVDTNCLESFLSLASIVTSACSVAINPDNRENIVSAEIMRYSEACAEALRAIMNILKCSNDVSLELLSPSNRVAIEAITHSVLLDCCRILRSDNANKDLINAAAAVIASVHYLARTNKPSEQLISFLRLIFSSDKDSNDLATENFNGISPLIVSGIKTFTVQNKSTLVRSFLSTYDNQSLLTRVSATDGLPNNDNSIILIGPFLSLTHFYCLHNEVIVRLCGLLILEAWFNKLSEIIDNNLMSAIIDKDLFKHLMNVASSLMVNWSHPSKQVSHMVPTVFQRLMTLLLTLQSASLNSNSSEFSLVTETWDKLILSAYSQSIQSRGRYQALTLLVDSLGASRVMYSIAVQTRLDSKETVVNHQRFLESLIVAVKSRDISSSVCSLISVTLRSIRDNSQSEHSQCERLNIPVISLDALRLQLVPCLSEALTSNDEKLRLNTADYLLPQVFEIDPAIVDFVIASVRMVEQERKTNGIAFGDEKLWSLVSINLHCRLLSLPQGNIMMDNIDGKSHGGITYDEMKSACLHENEEIRYGGLTALVSSQRTSLPLNPIDISILKDTFHASLKSSEFDNKQRMIRIVKSLMFRVLESNRIAIKEIANMRKRISALQIDFKKSGGNKSIDELHDKIVESVEAIRDCVKISIGNRELCEWLEATTIGNMYPGSTFEREIMSMDIISSILEVFDGYNNGNNSTNNTSGGLSKEKDISMDKSGVVCDPLDSNKILLQYSEVKTFDNTYLKNLFFTEYSTKTILNTTLSNWDRSRIAACQLLLQFPKPLPGFTEEDKVTKVVEAGHEIVKSAKQRESETGAFLLKTMMNIYCMKLGWSIKFQSFQNDDDLSRIFTNYFVKSVDAKDGSQSPTVFSDRCKEFMQSLCDLLEINLIRLEKLFKRHFNHGMSKDRQVESQSTTSADSNKYEEFVTSDGNKILVSDDISLQELPLCHGLLHTLKCCLMDCQSQHLFDIAQNNNDQLYWREFCHRVLNLSRKSLQTAMIVIAESNTDIPFAPINNSKVSAAKENIGKDELSVQDVDVGMSNVNISSNEVLQSKGPVNSSSCLSATYVNTNSLVTAGNKLSSTKNTIHSSDDRKDDISGSLGIQRAVVGAWLLVRESTATLAQLVTMSPPSYELPGASSSTSSSSSNDNQFKKPETRCIVLAGSEIVEVSFEVLDSLGRLKHSGAIAETQNALQTIAEALMRFSERSPALCRLPLEMLESLLRRLDNDEQVFILRRSAGFAYSFLALLRSEPANVKSSLLPIAMNRLLDIVEEGLDGDELLNSDANTSEVASNRWRMSVHALNVLRLIILDSALGAEIDAFVERTFILCMKGFKSVHWAIRNSSMMSFASIVTKCVDNDKSDNGGFHACKAVDFFQRYPLIFPYLVYELASVTHFNVEARSGASNTLAANEIASLMGSTKYRDLHTFFVEHWPESVSMKKSTNDSSENHTINGLHPSLYPILLLLSKFRSAMETSANGKDSLSKDHASVGHIDINLLVPLVTVCRESRFQQIRSIAAKALKSIISVQSILDEIPQFLDQFLKIIGHRQSVEKIPNNSNNNSNDNNVCSGILFIVEELLSNVIRFMSNNAVTMEYLIATNSRGMRAIDAIQSLLTEIVSKLTTFRVPLVHFLVVRILGHVIQMFELTNGEDIVDTARSTRLSRSDVLVAYQSLLLNASFIVLQSALPFNLPEKRYSCKEPFAPMAWKLSAESLSQLTMNKAMLISDNEGSCAPFANQQQVLQSMNFMLNLANNSISEVREGICRGLLQSLDRSGDHGIVNLCVSSSEASVVFARLMETLCHRMLHEREPPILSITLELFSALIKQFTFNNDRFVLFIQSINLSQIMHRLLVIIFGSSMEQLLPQSSNAKNCMEIAIEYFAKFNNSPILQTSSAAFAIEIFGWFISYLTIHSSNGLLWNQRYLEYFQLIVIFGSHENESVVIREAVVGSIDFVVKPLLSNMSVFNDDEISVVFHRFHVYLLLQLIRLMFDDDMDVRFHANRIVQTIILHDKQQSKNKDQTFAVIDDTIQAIVPVFAKYFRDWITAELKNSNNNDNNNISFIIRLIFTEIESYLRSESMILSRIHVNRDVNEEKVFDTEEANLFMEQSVCADCILKSLRVAIFDYGTSIDNVLNTSEVRDSMIANICKILVDRNNSIVVAINDKNTQSGSHGERGWLGGHSFEKEVFMYVKVYNGQANQWLKDHGKSTSAVISLQGDVHPLLVVSSK